MATQTPVHSPRYTMPPARHGCTFVGLNASPPAPQRQRGSGPPRCVEMCGRDSRAGGLGSVAWDGAATWRGGHERWHAPGCMRMRACLIMHMHGWLPLSAVGSKLVCR
eukprot:365803-Chlamydomonas_euryale.AAC.9